jgi:hypothetical protein
VEPAIAQVELAVEHTDLSGRDLYDVLVNKPLQDQVAALPPRDAMLIARASDLNELDNYKPTVRLYIALLREGYPDQTGLRPNYKKGNGNWHHQKKTARTSRARIESITKNVAAARTYGFYPR